MTGTEPRSDKRSAISPEHATTPEAPVSSAAKSPLHLARTGAALLFVSLACWTLLVLIENSGVLSFAGWATDYDYSKSSDAHPLKWKKPPSDNKVTHEQQLTLSLRFLIDEQLLAAFLKNGQPYADAFQTAKDDDGIRVEFDLRHGQDGRWGLSVGNGTHFDLGRRPQTGRWHDLNLKIADHRMFVVLNGKPLLEAGVFSPASAIEDVWSGSGYSLARPFPGQIRDFSLLVSPHHLKLRDVKRYLVDAGALGFILWLSACLLITRRLDSRRNEVRAAAWVAVVALHLAVYWFLKQSYAILLDADRISDGLMFAALLLTAIGIHSQLRSAIARNFFAFGLAAINYLSFFVLTTGARYLEARGTAGGPGLTFDEIGALYQSDPREIFEFFRSYFAAADQIRMFLFPLLTSVPLVMLLGLDAIQLPRSLALVLVGSGLATMPFVVAANQGIAATLFSALENHAEAAREFESYRQLRQRTSAVRATKSGQGETYVLVVGESANRDHFSAYGYFRPTTPWLDSRVGSPGWVLFRNAYSSHVHTVPSLLHALTASNQYVDRGSYSAASIIEIMNAAGFNTVWLSEQGVSWTDTPLNAMASSARTVRFVKPLGSILGVFRETMMQIDSTKNNFIVVHLIGSHADYRDRVPPGYRVNFARSRDDLGNHAHDQQFVNELLDPYDASIHYADNLLNEILIAFDKYASPTRALMFVSDHGEDVFGRRFHNASNFSYPMARIPMILNFSDEWAKRYRPRSEELRNNRDRIFTLDLLFDTLIGIAEVETEYRNPKFDLGSPDYAIDGSIAISMKRDRDFQTGLYPDSVVRPIRDDPSLVAIENNQALRALYGNKFIADRADILARTSEASGFGFPGVEINIAVPSYMIGHYPESVHQRSLDAYLKLTAVSSFSKLWFDLKLERGHSLAEAADHLEELDRRHKLKSRVILESPESGLMAYSRRGWHTTYYITEKGWPGCLANDREMNRCARQIAQIARSEEVKGISFPASHYEFVKAKLEPLLPLHVVYHTFGFENLSIFDPGLKDQLRRIAAVNDQRVRTILLESSQTFFERF